MRASHEALLRPFRPGPGPLPDSLDAVEIPPFIRRRLLALWGAEGARAKSQSDPRFPEWVVLVSRNSGLPAERVLAGCDLPLAVRPQDCDMWAKALRVDRVWFTLQVMRALFPEQVDMLLNPSAWHAEDAQVSATLVPPTAVTVTLTPAMLQHGYIDLPATASTMFPPTASGPRRRARQVHRWRSSTGRTGPKPISA